MNTTLMAFELVLLGRMSNQYQNQILEKANLSSDEANQIRRRCTLQYLDLFETTVKVYEQMFEGIEIRITSSNSTPTELWETRRVDLILWPHMEWEFVSLNGIVLTGCFRNRLTISHETFDLNSLQVGAWCKYQLEALALKIEFIDGWSEQMTYQLGFAQGSYEGDFVFGLLQSWKLVDAKKS